MPCQSWLVGKAGILNQPSYVGTPCLVRYIYPHFGLRLMVNVGRYSSPMEHLVSGGQSNPTLDVFEKEVRISGL